MTEFPKVSCLCVTRSRPIKLKRAINCFLSQSYPNKELIVVSEDDDDDTLSVMSRYAHPDIQHIIVAANPKQMLGDLRNVAIQMATGRYFCQWDDDDWYHCERLVKQVSCVIENYQAGSILTNWLIYDEQNSHAYFSIVRWWEGSILFDKRVLASEGLKYPSLAREEDSVFVQKLINKSRVYPLVSAPIYIYTVHGQNTWQPDHFNDSFRRSQKLSPSASRLIGEVLEERYSNQRSSALLWDSELLEEINFLYSFKYRPELEKQ